MDPMELKAIEVRTHGDEYIVQGWHRGTSLAMDFEKHYTLQDIMKADREAKGDRLPFARQLNPLSLSQVLRLAGNYVDRMGGRLLRVSWQDQSDKIQSITVQYDPCPRESQESSDAQIATIEEVCVHVYKQRKKIAASPDKRVHRPFVGVNNTY